MTKRFAVAVTLALVASSQPLRAERVDPRVPLRVVTGRAAPLAAFPERPVVAWQARLLEPMLAPPVADKNGSFVVAHTSGLVVELDASGRTRHTIRAGSSLALGPILLASRRRLLVTGDAEAVILLPSGRVESRQKLSFRELDSSAVTLATSDGGALIAAGARFARFGPTGELTARGSAREALRELFEWRGLALFVERGGRVLGLPHAGDPFEVAKFGRPVRACDLRGDRLIALVGERELVELDLETRAERTLWSEPPLLVRDLFVLPDGDVRVVATPNLVIALDATGRETFRVPQPGTSADVALSLLGDRRGAMLVAVGGADLRLVGETGDVVEIPATACPDPLRPMALSNGLVVASCRSGMLFGISGKAR